MFRSQRMDLPKKTNPIVKFFKFCLFVVFIAWIIFFLWYTNFKSEVLVESETVIKIEAGDKSELVAEKLWINKYYFLIYLKKDNPDFKIIEWNFRIKSGATASDVLKWLSTPIVLWEMDLTFLEWWNIYDMDEYLTKKDLIKSGEYVSYVTNAEKIEKLTEFYVFIKWLDTLEWFLYPDTYTVDAGNFKINNLVTKQLDSFEVKVYKKILENLSNQEIEQLINLASIVEKEEKNSDEKSTVAGILKKRLDNGWMIWADATVCYPHELTAQQCKLVVSKYIKEKSEYNTRTMKWLPKTPIWNPSFDTINATLNYKESPYWFYLHDVSTGKIYYAETNEEHNVNKSRY